MNINKNLPHIALIRSQRARRFIRWSVFEEESKQCERAGRLGLGDRRRASQVAPPVLKKNMLELFLDNQNQSVDLEIILIGLPNTAFDLVTKINHTATQTKSSTIVRAILFGNARINLNASACLPRGVVDSSATIDIQALMVGDNATFHALPAFEVGENRVTANHKVSVSQIDKTALSYLKMQGLNKSEATRLILNGFIEKILCHVSQDDQRRINEAISSELCSSTAARSQI